MLLELKFLDVFQLQIQLTGVILDFTARCCAYSDLSRPPRGDITPSFHATTPQPSEVQRGLSGGVYGGCLCDRDGRGQILT